MNFIIIWTKISNFQWKKFKILEMYLMILFFSTSSSKRDTAAKLSSRHWLLCLWPSWLPWAFYNIWKMKVMKKPFNQSSFIAKIEAKLAINIQWSKNFQNQANWRSSRGICRQVDLIWRRWEERLDPRN